MPEKRRLIVFDFDDTIANVPQRPQSGQHKRSWSGKDWWGSEASLTPPDPKNSRRGGFYDGSVNSFVISAFHESRQNTDNRTVLLTGRRGIIAHAVRNILRQHGLYGRRIISENDTNAMNHFRKNLENGKDIQHPDESGHEEYYCGDMRMEPDYPDSKSQNEQTLIHKLYVMDRILSENNGYFSQIVLWEDRPKYVDEFQVYGSKLLRNSKCGEFLIKRVFPPIGTAEGYFIDIPVKNTK